MRRLAATIHPLIGPVVTAKVFLYPCRLWNLAGETMTSLWTVLIVVVCAFVLWGTLVALDKARASDIRLPSIDTMRLSGLGIPRVRCLLMLIGLCLFAGGWSGREIIEAEHGFMQGEFGNRLGAHRWVGVPLGGFPVDRSLQDDYARSTYIQAAGGVLLVVAVPWFLVVEKIMPRHAKQG